MQVAVIFMVLCINAYCKKKKKRKIKNLKQKVETLKILNINLFTMARKPKLNQNSGILCTFNLGLASTETFRGAFRLLSNIFDKQFL